MVPQRELQAGREPVEDAAAANLLAREHGSHVVEPEAALVDGAGQSNQDQELDRAGSGEGLVCVMRERRAGVEVAHGDGNPGGGGASAMAAWVRSQAIRGSVATGGVEAVISTPHKAIQWTAQAIPWNRGGAWPLCYTRADSGQQRPPFFRAGSPDCEGLAHVPVAWSTEP